MDKGRVFVSMVVSASLIFGLAAGWVIADQRSAPRIRDLEASLASARSSSDAEIAELKEQVTDIGEQLAVVKLVGKELAGTLEYQLRRVKRRAVAAEECVDQLVQAYNRSSLLSLAREFQAALLGGSCGPLGYTFS